MYENIIKILDKSKAENVDILVARDKVIAEEAISYDEMKKASDFIGDYYDTITKCRRLGDNDTIKALVEADDKGRTEIVKEVADRVEK
jgi:hypothetical protein